MFGALTSIALVLPLVGLASGFEGRWRVLSVEVSETGSEWVEPAKLPASLEITTSEGRLLAIYVSQNGTTIHCMAARELIEGSELMLFGCPAAHKSATILSPIHRIKLDGNYLMGYAVTDKVVYTWSAVKAP